MEKRLTRARAVKEFCKTCMGWDGWYGGKVGTKPQEASRMVTNCESKNCPLYNFRTGRETTPGVSKPTSILHKDYVEKKLKNLHKLKKVAIHAQS